MLFISETVIIAILLKSCLDMVILKPGFGILFSLLFLTFRFANCISSTERLTSLYFILAASSVNLKLTCKALIISLSEFRKSGFDISIIIAS